MVAVARQRDRYSHRADFRNDRASGAPSATDQGAGSGAEDIPDTIQHRAVGHIPGIPEVGDPPQDARAGPEKAAGALPGCVGKRAWPLCSRTMKRASVSSTDHGGGKQRLLIGITGISRR